MSLPAQIVALLTSLTKDQIATMPPAERQLLSDQCERVHRIINVEMIVSDAQEATGVLHELRDGRGRQ